MFSMTERGHNTSGGTTPLIFRRGTKMPKKVTFSHDEEKGSLTSNSVHTGEMAGDPKVNSSKINLPTSSDIFSWHHLNYDITLKGGEVRCLLDDVSGYVASGKLVGSSLLALFASVYVNPCM